MSAGLTATAVALAVAGAACFAGAGVLQHRAVTSCTSDAAGERLRLDRRAFGALLRRPGWLAGLALGGGGAALHALALVLAPVTLVQPVGVLAVPIAVLLAARVTGVRPAPGVAAGVALCVAGVGGVVALAAGSVVGGAADPQALGWAGAGVAAAVLALAGVAARARGPLRCIACAAAGAAAFGLVSSLVRALAEQVAGGAAGLDLAATATAIGLALVVGGWLVQQAFAAGSPELVVACLTVVDPLVAVLLGVLLLGEGAAIGTTTALAMAGCAVVAAGGVVALARHHPDVTVRRAAGALPAPAHPVGAP